MAIIQVEKNLAKLTGKDLENYLAQGEKDDVSPSQTQMKMKFSDDSKVVVYELPILVVVQNTIQATSTINNKKIQWSYYVYEVDVQKVFELLQAQPTSSLLYSVINDLRAGGVIKTKQDIKDENDQKINALLSNLVK